MLSDHSHICTRTKKRLTTLQCHLASPHLKFLPSLPSINTPSFICRILEIDAVKEIYYVYIGEHSGAISNCECLFIHFTTRG